MSLICLVSAKGAPGTTTTAMLLAALWPRESVLVDADPLGGDVGLRLPSAAGAPLRTDAGLLRLLPAARRGLTPDVVLSHCQQAQGGQLVITGLEGPEQASAVGTLWDELGQAFATLPDRDVVVDAGQAHTNASTLPLLRRATAVVFVVQPTITGVVHTRQRVAALLPELAGPDGHSPLLGCVVVETAKARSGDTETAVAEVTGALSSLRFFGSLAHDRASARMFEGFPQRHPERSLLVRSGTAVISALTEILPIEQPEQSQAGGPPPAADGTLAAPARPPVFSPSGPAAPPQGPGWSSQGPPQQVPHGPPPPAGAPASQPPGQGWAPAQNRSLADLWLADGDQPAGDAMGSVPFPPPVPGQPQAQPPAASQPATREAMTRREARARRWPRKRGRS